MYFWIFLSYLLGSFPSGYLISRVCGKDILKIGWRKTSGSNVFKNVGKWQGALTGILDVFKGYLAVWGAQRLGFSTEIQIFSGVAAITGHNWSLFLKFAGGRGVGTLIGAFFALSPKILGFSLIPFAFLTFIWDASIGTLLFLATAILLSIYLKELEIAGLFTLFSLVPILIKRLSPIGEIYKKAILTPTPGRGQVAVGDKISKAGHRLAWGLIRNRLLFDNNEALLELRIKRLIGKIFQRE